MEKRRRIAPRRPGSGGFLGLVLFGALAVVLSATGLAWALGEISQKPGTAGCVTETGTGMEVGSFGECQVGRAFAAPTDIASSPDGRNVYVLSQQAEKRGEVAIFDRDPATGELRQKPGTDGCVSETTNGGACKVGEAMVEPSEIAVSPDGTNVYVTSHTSPSGAGGGDEGVVAIFGRDAQSGALSQSQDASGCLSQGGFAGPAGARITCQDARGLGGHAGRGVGLAISPDGGSVYVAGSGAVAIFKRGADGGLIQKGDMTDCVSQSGTDRKGRTCLKGVALREAQGIAISPDGGNIYVAARDSEAVAIFDRDAEGGLTQKPGSAGCVADTSAEGCQAGRLLDGAARVAISPNGEQVYVGSGSSDVITVLGRNPVTGDLNPRPGPGGCASGSGNGGECQNVRALAPDGTLTVSPDGRNLYAASGLGVAVLDRDSATGALTQKNSTAGCLFERPDENGCQGARGLHHPVGIVVSPDGGNLYTAGYSSAPSGQVAVFDRDRALPPAPDTTAPTVSGFRLSPARFRAAPRGRGAHFAFSLSEAATVSIEIQRALPGRAVGKRCKPPTPRLAKHRPCRRLLHAGTLRYGERGAGANAIPFNGRTGRRALAPGAYRATILATDAAGNRSAPRGAGFTVLVGRRIASGPTRVLRR